MDAQAILVLDAELGIGLAGFASLSAALSARVSTEASAFQRARVSTLVFTSLSVVFLAQLPMLLALAIEDAGLTWRISSGLCAGLHASSLRLHLQGVPEFRSQPDFSRSQVALAALALASSIALGLYNALLGATAWPYLLSLALALLVAASRFARLVASLWHHEQA